VRIQGASELLQQFTGEHMQQIERVGQIDSLEFRSCEANGMDFIKLIAAN
jgi:hypothetical protein